MPVQHRLNDDSFLWRSGYHSQRDCDSTHSGRGEGTSVGLDVLGETLMEDAIHMTSESEPASLA
jgi:hypothetical protein